MALPSVSVTIESDFAFRSRKTGREFLASIIMFSNLLQCVDSVNRTSTLLETGLIVMHTPFANTT